MRLMWFPSAHSSLQGLADVFILLGMPFDSPEAIELNRQIFETLYFAALQESAQLAKEEGPHPSYPGSPVSRGVLQQDMWGVKDSGAPRAVPSPARYLFPTARVASPAPGPAAR